MLVSAKGEDVLEQGEDKDDVWEPDAVDTPRQMLILFMKMIMNNKWLVFGFYKSCNYSYDYAKDDNGENDDEKDKNHFLWKTTCETQTSFNCC